MGQLAAVGMDEDGLVGPCASQGDAALFADQLFPVDAGADGDLGFQCIRHGENGFRNRGVIAAAILFHGEMQHRKDLLKKDTAIIIRNYEDFNVRRIPAAGLRR